MLLLEIWSINEISWQSVLYLKGEKHLNVVLNHSITGLVENNFLMINLNRENILCTLAAVNNQASASIHQRSSKI